MDKDKYERGSSVGFNKEQAAVIEKAKTQLEKSLGVTLARSQALAIFAHLYLAKDKPHG